MAANRTTANSADVDKFLRDTVAEQRLSDAQTLIDMHREITACEAKMWGTSIIGFDEYHYKYESGREGDSMLAGFSPRKREFAIYIMAGFEPYKELLTSLGKHRHTKSCLYIKQLADIDLDVLKRLIAESVSYMKENYG